jgi:hypothetical protein
VKNPLIAYYPCESPDSPVGEGWLPAGAGSSATAIIPRKEGFYEKRVSRNEAL